MNNKTIKYTLKKAPYWGVFTLLLFLFSSCDINHLWDKDFLFEPNVDPYQDGVSGVFVYDCTSYTDWHFFSFAEGKVIGSCDAMDALENESWRKRTDWDLAFHRQNIKSNSGVSGVGMGGIVEYKQDELDFDAVIEAPKEGYMVDVPDSVVYDMSQMMLGIVEYAPTGVNPETKDWAVLTDMMGSIWTYAKKVFVVRTADGKYAKIQLLNFKNNIGISGTVTMKYVYQADGSTNLNVTKDEENKEPEEEI